MFVEADTAGNVSPVLSLVAAGGVVPETAVNSSATAAGVKIAVGSADGYPAVWRQAVGGPWSLVTSLSQVSGITGLAALTSVTHGSAGWLAVGTPGPVILTSADGISWQPARGAIAQLRALLDGSPAGVPMHLHAAEQIREVEAVEAALGARPVAWLLEHYGLGPRWCLVHATHLDDAERDGLAACGAVAGLCPTTEANLGDGVFPLLGYRAAGGTFGIGSDSNLTIAPTQELR